MNRYTILPHTADIRFELVADTAEELFRQGLYACCHIAGGKSEKTATVDLTKKIEIESLDLTALLIDFLSELVSFMDSRKAMISSVEFIELSENKLSAIISASEVQGFDKCIKAVTYHEANVIKNESGEYSTVVVLDI